MALSLASPWASSSDHGTCEDNRSRVRRAWREMWAAMEKIRRPSRFASALPCSSSSPWDQSLH